MKPTILSLVALVALASLGVGCSNDVTPPTPATAASTTELFSGSLAPRDIPQFYSFTVGQAGTVSITLASLTIGPLAPATTAAGLGLGIPAGEGCRLSMSLNARPALTAQITNMSAAGISCAAIFDPGTLTSPVTFAIRIVHPT
jgi:hypothetical protein